MTRTADRTTARPSWLDEFTGRVLAHRRLVVVVWIALAVAGAASAGSATGSLSQRFALPGKSSYETNRSIDRLFRSGGDVPPFVAVLTLPPGQIAERGPIRAELSSAMSAVQRALPGSRVLSYASGGDPRFVSRSGRTTFALIYAPNQPSGADPVSGARGRIESALADVAVGGSHFQLTGVAPLSNDTGGGGGPGVFVETLVGAAGALAVLAFVFSSFLAIVPLLMAAVAIPTCFLIIWGIASLTEVSFIVQFLVGLIGLGVAIDYSLLVVVRWREERARGAANDEAVRQAMATAGHAVFFSGTTVAVGLLALIALPVPFLRSVGYAGMLIPLVSVAVALTLLPVLLATIGPRLDWPHRRTDERASRTWTRWAEFVTRHRWPAAIAALAALAALIVPAFSLKLDNPSVNSLAKAGPARAALSSLSSAGIGPGALSPIELLTPTTRAPRLERSLEQRVRGVQLVAYDGSWHRGGRTLIDVLPAADGSSAAGRRVLTEVRGVARSVPAAVVGGQEAQSQDFVSAVYGNFVPMLGLIALVSFGLLARAFRSIVLPVKAVLLNVLSVAATWGVLVLVWQQGHGSKLLWGLSATGSITAWIPLMAFAFLFGLSMDYEVFILSRIREEYQKTGSTDAAVITGIGRTGRLVTSAALILFLAFVSLASGPGTQVKMIATALAAGILLDATVVRALLVPAVVSLLGRWNWWMPTAVARAMRIPHRPPELEPAATHARAR